MTVDEWGGGGVQHRGAELSRIQVGSAALRQGDNAAG